MDNVKQPVIKRTPKWVIGLIIGGVILSIVIFVVALILIISSVFKNYYGTWECNNDIILKIDSSNFDMYTSDKSTIVNSKYSMKKVNIDNNIQKYTLNASATKRIINGVEYNDPYTTQYEITIDSDHPKESAMINTVTYSVYECRKK